MELNEYLLNEYLRRPDEPQECKCCGEQVMETDDNGICDDCNERFELLRHFFYRTTANEDFEDYFISHIDEIL